MSKKFHIGTILSVAGEILLSPEGMDGIYEILNYMTGDSLFTHQLTKAARACRPHLKKQLPQLEGYDDSSVTKDNHTEWLAKQIEIYGEFMEISPLEPGIWESRNPIEKAAEIMLIKKVYILNENTLLQVRVALDLDWMPRFISPSNLSWMIKNPEYAVDEAKVLSRNRLFEAAKDRRLLWIDPNDKSEGGDLG